MRSLAGTRLTRNPKTMFSATQRGPLAPYMHAPSEREMQQYYERSREALIHGASDIEHFLEENAGAVCIAGE